MTTSAIYYLDKPFVYPSDSLIGRFLELGRGWDSFLAKVIPVLVEEEEPTICEVGSNIGASLMQILAAKPRARVAVFEPSDRFRPYLLRNIEFARALDRVRVYPYLVGREAGVKKLYANTTTASTVGSDYSDYESRGEQLVEVVTLDGLVSGEQVHFIKIDTDGFEFEVLRGAVNTLKAYRPSLHFEFAPYLLSEPSQNLLMWLQGLNYKRFLCLTPIGEFIGLTEDPFEAVAWAQASEHRFCDVVTCAKGSRAEAQMQNLKLCL